MDKFLARSDIRAELGIPDHVKWEECNMLVHLLVSCTEHAMSSTTSLLVCCAPVYMLCSHGWHVEAGLSRVVSLSSCRTWSIPFAVDHTHCVFRTAEDIAL